jgi:hypothetical protein
MATLADLAQQYLNKKLPDISGIFSLPQASSVTTPVVEEEQVTTPQGLTIEQLRLMYPQMFIQQNQMGGDGGQDDDDDDTNTNNAGITSLGGLFDAVKSNTNIGSIIGGIIGGPFGAILGNKAYGAFTGRDGRGPGTGNLGGMGPGAFGPGLGEIDANTGFGSFADTGQVTADGNAMGGGTVGGRTGGANDGTSNQGSGSADDGFARGGRVKYLYGGLTSLL